MPRLILFTAKSPKVYDFARADEPDLLREREDWSNLMKTPFSRMKRLPTFDHGEKFFVLSLERGEAVLQRAAIV
jgi:hypothetical protein